MPQQSRRLPHEQLWWIYAAGALALIGALPTIVDWLAVVAAKIRPGFATNAQLNLPPGGSGSASASAETRTDASADYNVGP